MLGKQLFECDLECISMAGAQLIRGKAFVVGNRRSAEHRAQFAELGIVADRKEQIDRSRPICVVRRDVRMSTAGSRWKHAGGQIVREMRVQQRDPAVEQCRIDELPSAADATLMQGQKDSNDRVQAGSEVDHRHSDPDWRPLRASIDTHEPRHRLYHRIVARQAAKRTIRPESGNTAVDQPREALCKVFLPDSPAFQSAYLEVLDKHVCGLEEPEKCITPGLLVEIQDNSALVAVNPDEVSGCITRERRTPCARVVALRWLYFDYFGTVIAKDLRAEWPSQDATQVHHAQTG